MISADTRLPFIPCCYIEHRPKATMHQPYIFKGILLKDIASDILKNHIIPITSY